MKYDYVLRNKMTGRYYMTGGVDIKEIRLAMLVDKKGGFAPDSWQYRDLSINYDNYHIILEVSEIRRIKLQTINLINKYGL